MKIEVSFLRDLLGEMPVEEMDRKQTGRAYRPWCSRDSCPRRAETEEGKVYPSLDIIHMLWELLFLRQNGLKLII